MSGRFVVQGSFYMAGAPGEPTRLVAPGDVVEIADYLVITELLNRGKIEPDAATAKRLKSTDQATWEEPRPEQRK